MSNYDNSVSSISIDSDLTPLETYCFLRAVVEEAMAMTVNKVVATAYVDLGDRLHAHKLFQLTPPCNRATKAVWAEV